jgi:hypothetical protein
MTGYVLKRSETDYVVDCDSNGHGGYNVVPKEIDPYNMYNIEDVENYLLNNPDMLLDSTQIETDRLTREVRARRDTLLKEVVDAVNPMRWEALTDTQKDAWRAYRQALLDVPQQPGFPKELDWPVAPDETGGENE